MEDLQAANAAKLRTQDELLVALGSSFSRLADFAARLESRITRQDEQTATLIRLMRRVVQLLPKENAQEAKRRVEPNIAEAARYMKGE